MAECPYKHGDTLWCVATTDTVVYNGYGKDIRKSVFIRCGTFVGVVDDNDKKHNPGDYVVTGLTDSISVIAPANVFARQEEASLAAFKLHLTFLQSDENSLKEQYKYISHGLKTKRSEIRQFEQLVARLEDKLKGKEGANAADNT